MDRERINQADRLYGSWSAGGKKQGSYIYSNWYQTHHYDDYGYCKECVSKMPYGLICNCVLE